MYNNNHKNRLSPGVRNPVVYITIYAYYYYYLFYDIRLPFVLIHYS